MCHSIRAAAAVLALLGGLLAAGAPAPARAETYHACKGFIDSLPATITTQGTWCLRKDLSTAMSSGAAITIVTHNVTIDCNDFKLGGLAAGAGTAVTGIYAPDSLNVTVRHCNIRGFYAGVVLGGENGGGHVVEDNRLDGNTVFGINIWGDGSVVRRNQVRDTGGSTIDTGPAYAIFAVYNTDVLDNSVDGVLPSGQGIPYGIYTYSNTGGSINGNRVRGLVRWTAGAPYFGIYNYSNGGLHLRDNDLGGDGFYGGVGIHCDSPMGLVRDNSFVGFQGTYATCTSAGRNDGVYAP